MNFKTYRQIIRLLLFKSCLLFSVFAFSGFNLHAQFVINQAVKTELVVSKNDKPTHLLKRIYKKCSETNLAYSPFIKKSSIVWALIAYNNVLNNRFKQYKNRRLLASSNPVILLFIIRLISSEEKSLSYS